MPAGLNQLCEIWDFNYDLGSGDDEIGGAVPSGTVLYTDVPCRVQQDPPTQALLEQGIISTNRFSALIGDYTLDIENNNEIKITAPVNSPYYNKYFRILGDPERTSIHPSDSRGFLLVRLQRVERGRTIQ